MSAAALIPGRRGVGRALLAAVLFGVSTPLAKGLLRDVAPQLLAGLLYLGSGGGLALAWVVRRGGKSAPAEAPIRRADMPWLAAAILAGGVVGPVLLLMGLQLTAASTASLLLNLEGVFTAALAWVAFRESTSRRVVFGMAAIVAGGGFLSWQGRAGWSGFTGPLLVAGATFAWGLDNNLTQRVSAGDPLQVAMLKGLVAGTVNLALALLLRGTFPRSGAIPAALLLGFISYGASLVLFVQALRELGTARTAAYFSLAPFVGALLAFVLWRDPLSLPAVAGGALMALGLTLHLSERHAHLHVHEALEHEHRHVHDEHHRHAHAADTHPGEPHAHAHRHEGLVHSHVHYPDVHHRHGHG